MKHRRKLCEILQTLKTLAVFLFTLERTTLHYVIWIFPSLFLPCSLPILVENDCYSLSVHFCKRGMFRTVLWKHKTFRPRISSYYTGLSPRSLRRARSGKYDPTSFEREIGPRSFSISAINRNFLLPRCSEQLGSPTSFLAV